MALRTITKRQKGWRREEEITQRTWHRRKLVNVSGSLMITLPSHLMKWDRKRLAEPFRWQAGDEVEVALTTDSMFVVRYSPANDGRLGDLPSDVVKMPTDEEIGRVLAERYNREQVEKELLALQRAEERRKKAAVRAKARYRRERELIATAAAEKVKWKGGKGK